MEIILPYESDLLDYEEETNMYSPSNYDERIICGISKLSNKCLEIGTCYGRTAFHMAKFSPGDGFVVTLDYDDVFGDKRKYHNPKDISKSDVYKTFGSKVKFIKSNSIIYDFVRNGYFDFDFIFIDGSHNQFYVAADTRIALQLINYDGVILWHDFGNAERLDDVGKVVHQLLEFTDFKYKFIGDNMAYLTLNSTEVKIIE